MILILNLGLKSVRAIVFNERGEKLSFASQSINTLLRGVEVEQKPEEWWEKSIEVMQEALQDRLIREQVKFLAVTSSSCCLVSIDENGNSTGNSLIVSDKRSIKESFYIKDLKEYKLMYSINPNFIAQPSMMIPKILWIREHDCERYIQTKYWLSSNDYLVYKITGERITDPLNAEKFYYDYKNKTYASSLFSALQLDDKCFPQVRDIGYDVGCIRNEIHSLLGLKTQQRVKVILTSYDAICAFFGSGSVSDGEACDVSGTVSSFRVLSNYKPAKLGQGIFTQYEPTNKVYIVGGSNNLGGGLIEWAKQSFYNDDKYPYEAMEREAQLSRPGGHGLIFLPYLMGERAPLWNSDVRASFFGLERFHSRKDIIRAVFESTGYSLLLLQKSIEKSGIQVSSIRSSGGLARIRFLAQLKADILNKKILIVDEFETTSVGAFILAALSFKLYSNLYESQSIVKIREIILPNSELNSTYKEFAELYWNVYLTLQPLYIKRRELVEKIYRETIEKIENL